MTQSRSADAVPAGALAQRTVGPALALRNWRVARQLVILVAIPAVLILAFTGLWVTHEARSAGAYGRVGRLAAVGQQVTGLAQAMADERSATAAFISGGRPAAGLAALDRQYAITDAQAARVRRLVSQLGPGYPAQTQAGAAQVLASIAKLPGLRRQAAQSQASALAVVTGYSAATAGLFPLNDSIADLSGNSALISSARALGSLSRMIDHASQQQAILGSALALGRFGPGALAALTIAQAQQASDVSSFRGSATAEESGALTQTLARPVARQAQAVEQRAMAAGNGALALGPQASQQWSAGMDYTAGWMRQAERQLTGWITADAQALQQGAMRSALVTGGVGLGALALVLLGTIFAARSVVRRLRRLEAATPEGAGALLPASASAASIGFFWRNHALLERLLQQIDSMELNENDPERLARLFEMDHLATRILRNSDSALALAGQQTPRPAGPLALVDVLRAAASEIEEYDRVVLDVQQGVIVRESATTDTVHLLAELLENATTFSPEATQVIVSGHAVWGGGSLVTITDGGPGMPEEELALFNWQLDNPAPADTAVARRMGLFAVALLAARHGITVTLSKPEDGGTTAEVYLPAALISLEDEPGGEAPRVASGQEPYPGREADAREAVPLMLGAPVTSPAPGASADVTEPHPVAAEPGDGPPIFESVRSGYLQAFGRDAAPSSAEQAGKAKTGQPAKPPASWGEGRDRAVAGTPGTGRPAPSGLPHRIPHQGQPRIPHAGAERVPQPGQEPLPQPGTQRTPQPGQARGAAADQETPQDSVAELAEITRSKLTSFQDGSRRARAVAQTNRGAEQPEQDD